jgi:hypothetical protein
MAIFDKNTFESRSSCPRRNVQRSMRRRRESRLISSAISTFKKSCAKRKPFRRICHQSVPLRLDWCRPKTTTRKLSLPPLPEKNRELLPPRLRTTTIKKVFVQCQTLIPQSSMKFKRRKRDTCPSRTCSFTRDFILSTNVVVCPRYRMGGSFRKTDVKLKIVETS